MNSRLGIVYAVPAFPNNKFQLWKASRQQRPGQHRGSFAAGQHGLLLDPALELFVQALDRIRGPDRFSLAGRAARETMASCGVFNSRPKWEGHPDLTPVYWRPALCRNA